MPAAGPDPSRRASAHLKWASRYSESGNMHKAASHFGRAVDYARFGGPNATAAFMASLYAPGSSAQSVTNALYSRDAIRDTSDRGRDKLIHVERNVDAMYSELLDVVGGMKNDRMEVDSAEEEALDREIAEIKRRMAEYRNLPVFPTGADAAEQKAVRKDALLSLETSISRKLKMLRRAIDNEEKRPRGDEDAMDISDRLSTMTVG